MAVLFLANQKGSDKANSASASELYPDVEYGGVFDLDTPTPIAEPPPRGEVPEWHGRRSHPGTGEEDDLRITSFQKAVGSGGLLLNTAEHTMRHLVRYSLRSTPRRIVVGEVRDRAARDLLDAWITGHPGACATVHGEDAARALERLAALAQEATPGVDQRRMVAEAVHAVVFIHGHGMQRTVDAIAAVDGFDGEKFSLRSLLG